MKSKDRLVCVGGVGTGRIFQWAHLKPYLKFMDKARLVGFYDVNQASAVQAKEKYHKILEEFAQANPRWTEAVKENISQLTVYASLDEMLEHVDLIDIATTTRGRMESAIAALGKGVHSMGEKPMARTWLIADRAARMFAQKPTVFFQLNDDNVFDPYYRAVGDLVAQGAIGNVQSVWIVRGSRLDSTTVLKSQADPLSNGGGCLMDYGSHGMAGVLSVLGPDWRPVKVQAINIDVLFRHRILQGDPWLMESDDNAQFKVMLENAKTGGWATIFMEATWCGAHIGPKEMRSGEGGGGFFRIEGDKGMIDACNHPSITIKHWDGGETVIPTKEYPGETVSFEDEIGTMINCVADGRKPRIDINFGAEIIAICDAAYWSAIEKRTVTLEEFKTHARSYVKKYGDNEEAELALLKDLLAPYAWKGQP